MSEDVIHEKMPTEGQQIVLDVVIEDLKEKAEAGKEKYKTYLKTFNGRNSLRDAYQEALDLVMYLKQKLMEKENIECDLVNKIWPEGGCKLIIDKSVPKDEIWIYDDKNILTMKLIKIGTDDAQKIDLFPQRRLEMVDGMNK